MGLRSTHTPRGCGPSSSRPEAVTREKHSRVSAVIPDLLGVTGRLDNGMHIVLAGTVVTSSSIGTGLQVLAIAVVLLAALVTGQAFWGAKSDAERAASQKTLEERLDELSKSMRDSARLVEQVSAELEARAVTARRLTEEANTAEALAGLHKEQAEAVRRMMDAELTGTARRIRNDSIKIGIGSFVAGGGVTLAVTLLVRPLH